MNLPAGIRVNNVQPSNMKNILITGTSSGVGLEAALRFARNGYKVYATMRNLKKADELKEKAAAERLELELLELDVTKAPTIEQAVETVIERDGKIDVLLNNAGAGFAKTLEQTSAEEIMWVTDVNYLGVVRVTQAVLPHMRRAGAGRVISVSSVGGLVGQPFNELYCGAKFAVEGFTEALASYLTAPFGIHFSVVEPGGIATAFSDNAVAKMTANDGSMPTGPYEPIFHQYIAKSRERAQDPAIKVFQTAGEVADVILEVATAPNPPLRVRTSAWAEELCALKTANDPDGTKLVEKVKADFL